MCGSPTLGGQICADPCCADVPRRRMEPRARTTPHSAACLSLTSIFLARAFITQCSGTALMVCWSAAVGCARLCYTSARSERGAVQPMRCQSQGLSRSCSRAGAS